MPLVIHELVVTAEVQQRLVTSREREQSARQPLDREELIRECVEQVMRQLEYKSER